MAATSSSAARSGNKIKTLVLGIGNLLLRDEGVGVHAIAALRERYVFPEGLTLLDGGTLGLDLLPYVEGNDNLLIIDAVEFRSAPGTIRTLESSDIKTFLDIKFSVHQIGLPDMLRAAALTDILPPRLCLIGIQPDKIETGIELTGTIQAQFDALIDTVTEKLKSWGIDIKETAYVSGNPI